MRSPTRPKPARCPAPAALDPGALAERMAAVRHAGRAALMVIGTVGSVATSTINPLGRIAELCRWRRAWFHVDAAFGALASPSSRLKPLLAGIEAADSVAFDFQKWAQVPYDAGCIIVRDAHAHRAASARTADYLRAADRGLAAGAPWPVDLGPELSRGSRALKVWMTLSVYGANRLGAVVERCVDLAQGLASVIRHAENLELVVPPGLNVVCFRVRSFDDGGHDALAAGMQEGGRDAGRRPGCRRVADACCPPDARRPPGVACRHRQPSNDEGRRGWLAGRSER